MYNATAVRLSVTANARPSTSHSPLTMAPHLCYQSLWLWVQAAVALTITSISDNGGGVDVGLVVAVEWRDAVGNVNATLVSTGQNKTAGSISLLGSTLGFLLTATCADQSFEADVNSPFVWTATEDLAGGEYYFQLQDHSGDTPATSSPFSVQSAIETSPEPSLSSSPTVCTYL